MYVAHNAFYLACILRGCDMSTVFYTNIWIYGERLEGFLRCGCRYGLYPADQPTIVQLIEEADKTLFNNIRQSTPHSPPLLPKQIDNCYSWYLFTDPGGMEG